MEETMHAKMPSYHAAEGITALQIKCVGHLENGASWLEFYNKRFSPLKMPAVWTSQNKPKANGYLVDVEGNKSFVNQALFCQLFRKGLRYDKPKSESIATFDDFGDLG